MGAAAEMKQESRKSEQSFDQTLLEMGGISAMTDQQLGDADGIAACTVHYHSRAERKLASCLSWNPAEPCPTHSDRVSGEDFYGVQRAPQQFQRNRLTFNPSWNGPDRAGFQQHPEEDFSGCCPVETPLLVHSRRMRSYSPDMVASENL